MEKHIHEDNINTKRIHTWTDIYTDKHRHRQTHIQRGIHMRGIYMGRTYTCGRNTLKKSIITNFVPLD